MNHRLHNKVIVIIGGTGGLGLSAAQACVREGASVVVVGRDANRCAGAVELLDRRGHAVIGDASQPSTAERAIVEAFQRFGGFDGLYHVAGGSGRKHGDGPLHEISDHGWTATVDMNLTSVFYSNRAAVRALLERQVSGSILNMSSVLAEFPSPHFFATHTYATTKAGTIGLTKAAAAYYADKGIRFNVVAPALVDTPIAQRALGDAATMHYIARKQPLHGGRAGLPSDLDSAVVYFLSDESRFTTGQVLAVDGGWSVSG